MWNFHPLQTLLALMCQFSVMLTRTLRFHLQLDHQNPKHSTAYYVSAHTLCLPHLQNIPSGNVFPQKKRAIYLQCRELASALQMEVQSKQKQKNYLTLSSPIPLRRNVNGVICNGAATANSLMNRWPQPLILIYYTLCCLLLLFIRFFGTIYYCCRFNVECVVWAKCVSVVAFIGDAKMLPLDVVVSDNKPYLTISSVISLTQNTGFFHYTLLYVLAAAQILK